MKEIEKLIKQTKACIEGGKIRKEKYLNFLRDYFKAHKLNETCKEIGEKAPNVSAYTSGKKYVSEETLSEIIEKILIRDKKKV